MTTQILEFNSENIELCAKEILGGGVVAFPTETVYGLGANAFDEEAIKKIYVAKGRPSDNPLICHVSDKDAIGELGFVTPSAQKLIDAFMPGPITVIIRKKSVVPDIVTGGLDTVGVRMPMHKCALALISAAGVPICAPSANTSSRPSPTTAEHVLHDLDGKIGYILDGGRCGVGVESTIVDCIHNCVLRKGGISESEIERIIGPLAPPVKSDVPLCPGMKYKHYSPTAEVYLAAIGEDMHDRVAAFYDNLSGEKVIFSLAGGYEKRNVRIVGKDAEEYAKNLFYMLREADEQGYDAIICEGVSEDGIGAALMNRLGKASGGKVI